MAHLGGAPLHFPPERGYPLLLIFRSSYEELTCQERNFSTLENNQFS